MIPLQLQIKNFLSYGPELQTIDFSHYPLICLAGKNGHGKSALLDAITWALWGQARKVAGTNKPDQGLLHLGQTQMMVVFNFICNNTHYRVKREFTQTYGKPLAVLEFGSIDPISGACTPMTEKTIRATQAKIEETVHISFEAFINSAFLRQGQSHEFSTKSPKERKEILANILGLNDYERLRKYAMEKSRLALTQRANLELYHEKLRLELERIPTITTHLQELNNKLSSTVDREANLHKEKQELNIARNQLTEQQQQRTLLNFQHQQITTEENNCLTQLRSVRAQWKAIHARSCQSSQQQKLEEEKKELVARLNEHQTALQKNLEFKERYLTLKEQQQRNAQRVQEKCTQELQSRSLKLERIRMQKHTLEQEIHLTEKQYAHKETELKQKDSDLHIITTTLINNAYNPDHYAQQEKQFEKRKQFYHNYRSQGSWLTNELTSIIQKQRMVHDENNPSCPLCNQNVSASRRKLLLTEFDEQQSFLEYRIAKLTNIIAKLKELLLTQHKALEEAKKTRQERLQAEQTQQELLKIRAALAQELLALTAQRDGLKRHLEVLEKQIQEAEKELNRFQFEASTAFNHDEEYMATATLLADIAKQAELLAYNPHAHQEITFKLKTVEDQLALYTQLREQIALQEQRRNEISTLCTTIKAIRATKNDLTNRLHDLQHLTLQEQSLHQKEQNLTTLFKELNQERELLLQQKGNLEAQQEKLMLTGREHAQQADQIKALESEINDYQAIAQASSKDGIQALLIEDAIPEIEQEANTLLAKLTNNQSHLSIESLRDLKKGGSKETLDIKISDAAGIRPYELFSGGEAFRIDFALRIAISKLLARRAGTSLQTLIIDEGFGSQDDEGLSHIMDAIHKIQEDFSKVIIVSHMPAMKDQFPVHFFVEKRANGSTVQVIEHD